MNGKLFLLVIISIALLIGCSEQNNERDKTSITFLLTDMPGEYQEVNIDIISVKVISNDSLMELNTNQGVYNLLDFTNGKDTVLVEDEIPGGMISQIRLVLGENNTVMVDSVVYDLKTPSAQQSGLKLNVHEEFLPGIAYSYVIDFDAAKSIVRTGNGKYILKPVIKVFTEALTGSIAGVVQPAEARPLVMAIYDDDTATTSADTVSGAFMVRGLEEASYELEILPVEGFKDTTLSDIAVLPGEITEVDTIRLD